MDSSPRDFVPARQIRSISGFALLSFHSRNRTRSTINTGSSHITPHQEKKRKTVFLRKKDGYLLEKMGGTGCPTARPCGRDPQGDGWSEEGRMVSRDRPHTKENFIFELREDEEKLLEELVNLWE
ncbi:hypothetical protein KGY73_11300 [bacterium]|nr:hypothetical protein [bacterium]